MDACIKINETIKGTKELTILLGPIKAIDPNLIWGVLDWEALKTDDMEAIERLKHLMDLYIKSVVESKSNIKGMCTRYLKLCFIDFPKWFSIFKIPSKYQMSKCGVVYIEDKKQHRNSELALTTQTGVRPTSKFISTGSKWWETKIKRDKALSKALERFMTSVIDPSFLHGFLDEWMKNITNKEHFNRGELDAYVSLYVTRGLKEKRVDK